MVGKGVGIDVLAKLFFYASLYLLPKALPLSILLASLMTFGNLGEHLELLAMKASGVSLLQIMKPLIYVVLALSGISLYFQHEVVPRVQTKTFTILLSLKQTSPELEIPEGSFYKEIPGYNVYVRHKDKKNGLLRDLMIYDYSKGFENGTVIAADSGRLSMSDDKKTLILNLYSGSLFQNYDRKKSLANDKNLYRRETFTRRTILIDFDTNFEMVDESIMGSREAGKNGKELMQYIDSVSIEQDSVAHQTSAYFKRNVYANTFKDNVHRSRGNSLSLSNANDSLFAQGWTKFYEQLPLETQIRYLEQAHNKTDRLASDYNYQSIRQLDERKALLSHIAQLYGRYSMALSCLLFFFIGAPLGAIVRKGGLGMPAVLSVLLYLLYYTVDLFGTKMVKQDVWPVWQGVWFSSAILLALGVFFTYQALNDSTMLNPDDWKIAFQKFMAKIAADRQKRQKKSRPFRYYKNTKH
jgi:lipopolysaccharide export system permease protein